MADYNWNKYILNKKKNFCLFQAIIFFKIWPKKKISTFIGSINKSNDISTTHHHHYIFVVLNPKQKQKKNFLSRHYVVNFCFLFQFIDWLIFFRNVLWIFHFQFNSIKVKSNTLNLLFNKSTLLSTFVLIFIPWIYLSLNSYVIVRRMKQNRSIKNYS